MLQSSKLQGSTAYVSTHRDVASIQKHKDVRYEAMVFEKPRRDLGGARPANTMWRKLLFFCIRDELWPQHPRYRDQNRSRIQIFSHFEKKERGLEIRHWLAKGASRDTGSICLTQSKHRMHSPSQVI